MKTKYFMFILLVNCCIIFTIQFLCNFLKYDHNDKCKLNLDLNSKYFFIIVLWIIKILSILYLFFDLRLG